jgi:DNA modification methylase
MNGSQRNPAHMDVFSSTLLAARALGCQYLGIELDAKYHAIACNRLAQARQRKFHD